MGSRTSREYFPGRLSTGRPDFSRAHFSNAPGLARLKSGLPGSMGSRILPLPIALLILALAAPARAQGPSTTVEPLAEMKVVGRVTAAADRALEYLAAKQKPDGSWHTNQAVNGLALLAFMGRGHVPGRGMYRDVLAKGKGFLLATARQDGYLSFAQMYEHGIATLALGEMYGMDPDPAVGDALRKAVELIVKAQSDSGGWRYNPQPGDQDLSVTVMMVVALRAASNAEVPVPAKTIEKAIAYVRSCTTPTGGFGYQAGGGPKLATSAAGVLSLQLLGKYDDPEVAKALDFVDKIQFRWDNEPGLEYFYYFHYYSVQAHYQAGGKRWDEWHPRLRELLLAHQNADGSWDCPPGSAEANEGIVGPNKVYWTAMAALGLEIYMHFLPAYQR